MEVLPPSNQTPEQGRPRSGRRENRAQHSVEVVPHTPGRGLGFQSRASAAGNEGVIIRSGSLVKILEGQYKGSIGVVLSVLEVTLNRLVVEFPWGTVSVNKDMVTIV